MSTPTTTSTLAALQAQLGELAEDRRANRQIARLPDDDVADRLAGAAQHAERRAVLLERERELWLAVLQASYLSPLDQQPDDAVLLLRDAANSLCGHVGVEALEARRYADGCAETARMAAERRAEQGGVR